MFFDDRVFEKIAHYTNKHAIFVQNKKGVRDKHWYETSADEIKAFVGVLLYMGIVKLPTLKMYFQTEFVQCPLVANAFTYHRFTKIDQYLHLVDEEEIEEEKSVNGGKPRDFLYKCRLVLDVMEKFKDHYNPDCELSVDEAMIGFKGRLCIKQYMSKKPTKWGIKVWTNCDSKSGYLLKAKIYLGKKEALNKDLLLGEQVVLDLCDFCLRKYHHIYCDNFFTSVRLFRLLLDENTYACGTVRQDRQGFPQELKTKKRNGKTVKKTDKADKLERGDSKIMQAGEVTAILWQDKREVRVLSTNCPDPSENVVVQKRSGVGNEKIAVNCPKPIFLYNNFMNGVDKFDQKRKPYGIVQKRRKWWKYVFYFVINASVVNSFIIYESSNRTHLKPSSVTLLNFQKNLAIQLMNHSPHLKKNQPKQDSSLSSMQSHSLVQVKGLNRQCVFCTQQNYKTDSGYNVRTSWKCQECDIFLCKVNCFVKYHETCSNKKPK